MMNARKTAVLVTGGCGFIGSNLVATLARDGAYRITVVDDLFQPGSVAVIARVKRNAEW